MTWKAVARSAIGTSHQRQYLPCQDYGSDRILGDVIMGAIADGAGSAKHADTGAKLAVETVLDLLVRTEEWFHERHGSWRSLPHPPSQEQANKLFTKVVAKARSVLQKHATHNGYSVDDLACTLLAFVATPAWIAAMQIGDGFIVVRPQKGDYQLIFRPDKGEYANQTTFVTSTTALDELQVRVLSGQQTFICASTDALERVAIRLSDWTVFPPFFKPLEEYLQETQHPEQEDTYLLNFLESDRLSARTDDDKTLLLGLYS
ncbi:MAG: protein phosphatase 2C domain-containing protein [Leptolyngbyaceae cyanobacterium RU_5_1]|nr:protein phosphatase 2C domain-containing protein [Leptolyngbyaceae cyanobacterium RU_5_1]